LLAELRFAILDDDQWFCPCRIANSPQALPATLRKEIYDGLEVV